jgi:predicted Zn-dependent protease
MKLKFLTGLILAAATLSGCSESPTGRMQLKMISSSELNKMGAESFEQMKAQQTISADVKLTQFVQCVADHITPNVSKKAHDGSWEVVLFDSPMINAFALPGGKIGVYTGILDVTENQDQLAAIMGHEVGHVIANHSNERMSANALKQKGLQLGNILLGDQDDQTRGMVLKGADILAQYGLLMPYGRSHEKEADIVGQELMAKSGFDPKAAVALWHNMAKVSKGAPHEFLSTHPSNETRIEKLTENLSVTQPIYQASSQKPNCKKPS